MLRYFSVKRKTPESDAEPEPQNAPLPSENTNTISYKSIDLNDLPSDPSEHLPIEEYDPNQKDEIRRAYLISGPCEPCGHEFPQREFGGKSRRFRLEWYKEYENCDAFVKDGFNTWNKAKQSFTKHVGGVNSFHNKARKKDADLLRQKQSIHVALDKQTKKQRKNYRRRISTSVYLAQALLNGGLPFRGSNEYEDSPYRGHFIEFLRMLGKLNEEIGKVILENAPRNCQLTYPKVQKDICHCLAQEVLMRIFDEIGDDVFSILVDESRDVSKKEQMAVVLRFVDTRGVVQERFVGIVHVKETTSQCLKSAIDDLFDRQKLSFSRVRRQGYNGARNMSGEFNGLKAQILKENSSAYFVHCFAHQLQLVVVALANKHDEIYKFFDLVSTLTNVVCASCKRTDMIRDRQRNRLEEQIGDGEVETGKGKNQEISLSRAGDTRWSSHHKTLVRLLELYPTIIEVLEYIEKSGKSWGVTRILSDALQRKDQDILNAVKMVRAKEQTLQKYRLEGFNSLLEVVTSFCEKYDIEVINLEEDYTDPKKSKEKD